MRRDRSGFTMVELIVVTVLGSLVLMAALTILVTNERTYSAQNATITGQQSTRMALEVLFDELREVSPSGGDILSMSSSSIRVRLMRKFSVVCDTNYGLLGLGNWRAIVRDTLPGFTLGAGTRFVTGDSVYIFADNNERSDDDDTWIGASVQGVDGSVTCPQDGSGGTELRFSGQGPLFATDSVGIGAPVRSYRHYTFALTTYNGDTYLGRQEEEVSADTVPIAGPLRAGNGLEFGYRDALGAVTTTATDVRQIVVTIRTGSGVLNSLGKEVSDSITSWIYTRN